MTGTGDHPALGVAQFAGSLLNARNAVLIKVHRGVIKDALPGDVDTAGQQPVQRLDQRRLHCHQRSGLWMAKLHGAEDR